MSPENILKENGLSVTKARTQVLKLFLSSKKPLSIFDFKKRKVFQDVNESSLYRNLTKLEEAGIIQAIPSSKEYQLYELAPRGHHHHHIVCTSCKKIQCLTECGLDKRFSEMAKKVGFLVNGHSLELFGLCRSCQC